MSGKTKVYRFRLYDIAAEEFRLSARMATQACIRRIHAQLIRSSEMRIDKRHLDADGMTAIIYADPLAGHEVGDPHPVNNGRHEDRRRAPVDAVWVKRPESADQAI